MGKKKGRGTIARGGAQPTPQPAPPGRAVVAARPPLEDQENFPSLGAPAAPAPAWGGVRASTSSAAANVQTAPPGFVKKEPAPVKPEQSKPVAAKPPEVVAKPPENVVAIVPKPSTENKDIAELTEEFQKMFKPKSRQLPTEGKSGRPIDLVANTFELNITGGKIYHYDVEIDGISGTVKEGIPEKKRQRCASTVVNQKVIQLLALRHKKELGISFPAFDGRKNLYAKKDLGFKNRVFEIELDENGDKRNFSVKITRSAADPIDLSIIMAMYNNKSNIEPCHEAIMALDIIFRTGPTLNFVPVGRSYFMTGIERGFPIQGSGKDVEFGIYSSIRLGKWKPIVNIDMSATLFYAPQPLVNFMKDVLFRGRCGDIATLDDRQRITFQKEIMLLKVVTKHTKTVRKHRIDGLEKKSANEMTFDLDGKQVSVAQYFAQKYKLRLRYPGLPLVVSGKFKKTYIPMELCEIMKGQHYKRKASDFETAEMIKKTARPPKERFQTLQRGLTACQTKASDHLKEFGISVSNTPMAVKGRVLDAIAAEYADGKTVRVHDGAWKFDNMKFFRAATIKTWAVMVFIPIGDGELTRFLNLLVSNARRQGIQITDRPATVVFAKRFEPVEQVFEQVKRKHGNDLDIAVCVINDSDTYCKVKSCGETRSNLLMVTQCVKKVTCVNKCNDQVGQNIMQKMNTKMGGINHAIVKQYRPLMTTNRRVMYIGIDVNHAKPHDIETPSIVAFCATYDDIPSKYYNTTAVQCRQDKTKLNNNRLEVVQDAERLFGECYDNYFKYNKAYPQRIVIYRDGVSEGEFNTVLQTELVAMRHAVLKRDPNHVPSFLFITVQKRHHVRLRPSNDREGVGRAMNVPPGTVVDSGITNPNYFDFYLVSQFGIQGTSKPCHYFVLHNDEGIPPDEIIRTTYYLCHVFFRCARVVSLPAPVYYAHLGAERAKNHLNAVRDRLGMGSDSRSSGGRSDGDRIIDMKACQEAVTVSPLLKPRNIYT